jgi:glucosamine-6-phosphate deaminase
MKMVVLDNALQFEKTVALFFAAQVIEKPNSVIGMAGGTTTTGIHRELVELYKQGVVSFKEVRFFSVDERFNVPPTHKDSVAKLMRDQLYDHVDVPKENINCPGNGNYKTPQEAMDDYGARIAALGGLDMHMLPLGENGHIGFCQPGTPFNSVNWHLQLPMDGYAPSPAMIEEYGSLDKVPMTGLTLGIRDMMMARKLVFIAKTPRKAEIVAKALKGPVTTDVPASVIQIHPNAFVFLDKDAAAKL